MNEDVSNWIVDWFFSRGKLHCSAREALGVDYLQSGLLTSLEIVELVSEIEDHFGIQFSETEMQDPLFSSVGGLAELVTLALGQASKVI